MQQSFSGKKLLTCILILSFLFPVFFFTQHNKVEKKKSELELLRQEIRDISEEIKKTGSAEKKSYTIIEQYNRRSYLINRLIIELKNEQLKKDVVIDSISAQITSLEDFSKFLKQSYARYIVSSYKGSFHNELGYLLNAGSLHQAIVRFRFLKSLSEKGRNDLDRIKATKNLLSTSKSSLENEKAEKQNLIIQKSTEEKVYTTGVEKQKEILKELKGDRDAMLAELDAKKKAVESVVSLIDRLNREEESVKKETVKKTKEPNSDNQKKEPSPQQPKNEENKPVIKQKTNNEKYPDVKTTNENLSSFSTLKGRLNTPVLGASIFRRYGENFNPKLNTTTVNYGVDLKTKAGSFVTSSAEGIVSAIEWIPGYGSVVIINHKDGYRTVYGHLSDINVAIGGRINSGGTIGKVNETLEGFILHFEIWKQRTSLNPEGWFGRGK